MHPALRFLILAAVASTVFHVSGCTSKPPKKAAQPPEVTVVQPLKEEVTRFLEYTGTLSALETVEIRARVPGFLEKICFQPRSKVKAGDLLFVIDPRQFEANVKEAQGKLDAQKAAFKLAQTEVQISQQLESHEAISTLKLEVKVADRDKAGADVELAEAELAKAKLDLEWSRVTSPINGRVSRNKVDVGNLVGATEKTLLTTVVNDDPIYAYFNMSELDLLPISRKFLAEGLEPAKNPSRKLPIYAGLADEKGYPHEGHFDFAETTVDSSTGTIQVRGLFPNPDGLLMAGMFVRVRIPVEKRTVLVVPDVAIQFDQGGRYVLTVDDKNIVAQKRIKLGEQVNGSRVIEEGLTSKDRVMVTGVLRARPGSAVKPTATPAGAAPSDKSSSEKTKK
jgi:membrane fusion protein, multidrug efflux system